MLQSRDLTPEDYELLLRLDEAVPKRDVAPADVLTEARLPSVRAATRLEEPCFVCLEAIEPTQDYAALPVCGHTFHSACIRQWLSAGKNACPLCRKVAIPIDSEE